MRSYVGAGDRADYGLSCSARIPDYICRNLRLCPDYLHIVLIVMMW